MHSIYKGILLSNKQELCHEHLRAYASIIKNERMNSINMLLQFSSGIVRRMLHLAEAIGPTHTFMLVLRIKAPDGFLAGDGLRAAVAIRLVGTEGKTQPLAP